MLDGHNHFYCVRLSAAVYFTPNPQPLMKSVGPGRADDDVSGSQMPSAQLFSLKVDYVAHLADPIPPARAVGDPVSLG